MDQMCWEGFLTGTGPFLKASKYQVGYFKTDKLPTLFGKIRMIFPRSIQYGDSVTLVIKLEAQSLQNPHMGESAPRSRKRHRRRIFKDRNVMAHFRKSFKERWFHGPILEIIGILQEDFGHFISIVQRVIGENIIVGVWPVEMEIFDKRSAEGPGGRVLFVLKHKTFA